MESYLVTCYLRNRQCRRPARHFVQRVPGLLCLQPLDDGHFRLRFLPAPHRLVHPPQTVVRIGFGGVQPLGFAQFSDGLLLEPFLGVKNAQIQMCDANVRTQPHGLFEQGLGSLRIVSSQGEVSKPGISLRVRGIVGQFQPQLALGLRIAPLLS